MTSAPVRDPLADHLLTPQNAAFLFIDYQPAGAVEAQPLIPSPIRIVAAHWARSRSSLPAVCGSRW
jgi:hypothetical protein